MLNIFENELSEHCQALVSPSGGAVFLASFILVGILASYIPQHLKIITRRSSEGLSPWWVLLGSLSSIAAIGNILVLPSSRADIKCCKELDGGSCAAALLGVAQIGCQWACFMFIVMLFMLFFPRVNVDPNETVGRAAPTKRQDAVLVGGTTLLALLVVFITSVAMVAAFPHHTQRWADILGFFAMALAAIQYIPQIWYTYKIGDVKSLSLTTMVVQAPGAFLFAYSLWLRVGTEGWSAWSVYIFTGSLQGLLLWLGLYYYIRDRRLAKRMAQLSAEDDDAPVYGDGADEQRIPGERRPLLSDRRSSSHRQAVASSSGPAPRSQTEAGEAALAKMYTPSVNDPPSEPSDDNASKAEGKKKPRRFSGRRKRGFGSDGH